MAYNYVTLSGTVIGAGNEGVTAKVEAVPSNWLTLTDQPAVMAPQGFVDYTDDNGNWTLVLLSTDSEPISPDGWFWTLTTRAEGVLPTVISFFLPFSNGSEQNITDQSPLTTAEAVPPTYLSAQSASQVAASVTTALEPYARTTDLDAKASLDGATFTGPVSNSNLAEFHLDSQAGTTDDDKIAAALAGIAAFSTRGGTITCAARQHTFNNAIATTFDGSHKQNIRITGTGGPPHGESEGIPNGSTTFILNYAGSGVARMNFQHGGSIELDHLVFKDTAGSPVAFFQTTNAQPYIHDCFFVGSTTLQNCFQDAIYMGGLASIVTGAGDDAPFQAYQGVVERCSFYGIRTAVWCRTYANSITMRDLMISNECGAPNLFSVTDGAMTAASATLTCTTSAPFTSAMVGQVVLVSGAGFSSRNSWLIATISAYISATQVTLSCNATKTITSATVVAPTAAAIQIGAGNSAGGGVEGCVVDSSCIEVNGYAVSVLFNKSSNNALTATALWDGASGITLCGVGSVAGSNFNYVHLTEPGVPSGGALFLTDQTGNTYGSDVIIAPNGGNQSVVQLPNVTINGSEPLNIFGLGSTAGGAAIAFGPPGGPADSWILRDAAGGVDVTPGASGAFKVVGPTNATNAFIGTAVNQVQIGCASTGDMYWIPTGSGATINSRFRAKGTGAYIDLQAHVVSALAGTPTIAAGAGAGTAPTVSVVGNDIRGTITIVTGTAPVAGLLATITFNQSYASIAAPFVVVGAASAGSGALDPYVGTVNTTTFQLACDGTPAASTTYKFNYHTIG